MIKLNKVTRECFDHENTVYGFYVSLRFLRGMWDVYVSDDTEGGYTCNTFLDFLPAHEWADEAADDIDAKRRGCVTRMRWTD